jgi:transcriptional regulator with XRE-family HTH domain
MTEEIRTKFGKRLRRLRRMQDVTQEQLSEKSGVSSDFISQIERGLNSPSLDTIQKLADGLGVPIEELFQFHP